MNTWRMTGSTSFVRFDEAGVVGRHVAPAEQHLALRPVIARSISCSHAMRDAGSCGRNTMPTPYWPSGGSFTPCFAITSRQEASGIWIRMPAPSESRVAARRAAVREVAQDRQALLDDGVRLLALDVRDEAEAAGVVLVGGKARVVKAYGSGLAALASS